MRRAIGIGLLLLVGLLVPRLAEASILCKWFGRCFYESPGFRFTVVDRETGQPLADVHALAEWVQYGPYGRNGPLMVQDASSGSDGALSFPAWGPIRGSSAGLVLNHDPAITLFKPEYKVLTIFNVPGTDETARVRGLRQDGETFTLEPFRGSLEEWVEQLRKAAYPGTKGRTFEDQLLEFRVPYLNRMRRVWGERENTPLQYRKDGEFFWHVERSMRFYEESSR